MILALPRTSRRAAAALALVLIPLAGCGGDEGAGAGSGASLARLAPASSPFYVEAAIRPEGDRKAELDGLIAKFTPGQDAEKLLARLFKSSSDKVDYARDVKPWLGERAAIAVTGLPARGGSYPDVAAIVETKDADKALAAVRKGAKGKLEDRSYGGVKYSFDAADKSATAIIDGELVGATEPAFKAVVDTSKGDGLDKNAEYAKVVGAVDKDALGFAFGDVRRALELAKGSPGVDAKQLEGARELLDRQGLKTFGAALTATDTSVKLRFASAIKDDGQGEAAAKTLAELPAGSWAALGLGDLGKSLSDALDSISSLSGAGFDVQSGLDQLKAQAGIDVQKDLLSWMGQSGLFVRGSSLTDIGGALVVQSKDPAATKAALSKARTVLAGGGLQAQDLTGKGIDDGFSVRPANTPVELFAALAGDRFVLAVSRPALDEAIDPAKKLADDDGYKAAAGQLGDGLKPTFFLDFPKISGLIGLGAGAQPGYAKAKPYLDKIKTIVAGSKREGDLQLQTTAIGIR